MPQRLHGQGIVMQGDAGNGDTVTATRGALSEAVLSTNDKEKQMERFMRCKFRVNKVQDIPNTSTTSRGVMVEMGAVYEPDDKKRQDPAWENSIFGKYTPSGSFQACIYNPHLVELLPSLLGKEVYVDFTLAPEANA